MAAPASPAEAATRRMAEAAARDSRARLLAILASRDGDLAAAEDALAEAFAAALDHWPRDGAPDNPQAWLLVVARRRLTDAARRQATARLSAPELRARTGPPEPPDDAIPDHRLALLLACADPVVEESARAPLMLQVVLGLDAARIAGAFLMTPSAMAQLLVRAKRRLRDGRARFVIPDRAAISPRLADVLAAIYAAYAAAVAAEHGGDLAGEAVWLARLCAALAPDSAEALGLTALLLHLEARRPAGRNQAGDYVPLSAQDPAAWNVALRTEAEAALRQAAALDRPGRFQIEAAIASAHAERARFGRTDWAGIVALYGALAHFVDSPVVAVNRAVALAEIAGPARALADLRALAGDTRLLDYQPYWAAVAGIAARAGQAHEAAAARQRAAGLATDPAVRRYLLNPPSLP